MSWTVSYRELSGATDWRDRNLRLERLPVARFICAASVFIFFEMCPHYIWGYKTCYKLSGFEIVGFKSQRRGNGGKNSFCRQRRTGPIIMICLLRNEAGDQEQEQGDFRQASRRLTRARFEDQEGRNPSQGCGNRAFQFPGRSSPPWAGLLAEFLLTPL